MFFHADACRLMSSLTTMPFHADADDIFSFFALMLFTVLFSSTMISPA